MQCRLRRLCFLGIILFAVSVAAISAQAGGRGGRDRQQGTGTDEPSSGQNTHPLRGRAIVLDINARVVEQNHAIVWSESYQKTTINGSPVEIRLVSASVIVVAQFTPYIRRNQRILVAQGQIWINVPGEGIKYHTTMQTIPVEFNEPIYFFPLGQLNDQNPPSGGQNLATIEVMLTLHPYEE